MDKVTNPVTIRGTVSDVVPRTTDEIAMNIGIKRAMDEQDYLYQLYRAGYPWPQSIIPQKESQELAGTIKASRMLTR